MPLAARVAHARLLLAAGRFSGDISGQPMVDPGRSDVEDSYGGGLDGRWWLMSENRRLEASVAADDRGLFPARWGGENDENHRGFSLQQGRNLSVVVRRLETAGKWRSDEREGVAGERREMLWVTLRWERWNGTPVQLRPVIRWISDGKIVRLWLARSAVDRTVWMSGGLIGCDAVHRNLGTPGDVAQRYQSLDYVKGWDVFGF